MGTMHCHPAKTLSKSIMIFHNNIVIVWPHTIAKIVIVSPHTNTLEIPMTMSDYKPYDSPPVAAVVSSPSACAASSLSGMMP